MRTANPALSENVFRKVGSSSEPMTVSGAINKTMILIVLLVFSAAFTWNQIYPSGWSADTAPSIPVWYFPAIIVALILAFVIVFKQTWAPYLAPVYALLEGCAIGVISALFEAQYPGVVVQAAFGTMGVLISMLLIYKSGLIKVNDKFRMGVVAATGGIMLLYMINLVMGFFGSSIPMIHSSSNFGIGFSLVVIAVAALNLVLDFDYIERGARQRAPKYMEWYTAFGLLVTLIWLYLEILRLLGKTRSR